MNHLHLFVLTFNHPVSKTLRNMVSRSVLKMSWNGLKVLKMFEFVWNVFICHQFLQFGLSSGANLQNVGRHLVLILRMWSIAASHYHFLRQWSHYFLTQRITKAESTLRGFHHYASLRLSDVYMRQETRPSLLQIMVCCPFGAKPLSETMLEYCQWNFNRN